MLKNYNIHIIDITQQESDQKNSKKKTYKQSNKLLKSSKKEKQSFSIITTYVIKRKCWLIHEGNASQVASEKPCSEIHHKIHVNHHYLCISET